MKRLVLLFLVIFYTGLIAQNEEVIRFRNDITNLNRFTPIKDLYIIDARHDKTIGKLAFGKEQTEKEITFSEDVETHFTKWYKVYNTKNVGDDMVFVLKKLKVETGISEEGKNIAKIDFAGATFRKLGEDYHFVTKKDSVFTLASKNNLSNGVMRTIPGIVTVLLKSSFKPKPWRTAFSKEEISDFDSFMLKENKSLTEVLKDGIYEDYESFFYQEPTISDYTLQRDKRGEVIHAIDNTGKLKPIYSGNMFAFVREGVAYKRIPGEFITMEKNAEGKFYVSASRNSLFPQANNTYMMYGALGAMANIIVNDIRNKKESRTFLYEVIIDPLTGEYDFPDSN